MGRALAHERTDAPRFEDPTALALLTSDARDWVERVRLGTRPKGARERFKRLVHDRQSKVMVARTVAIDDAIRTSRATQLVILGAGLDGRAWRMPELAGVTVFEVDHPDTQREKRGRVGALSQTARDVRFVPVDFERDGLASALEAAGHDSARATTWVWEGVVMYLAPADIAATLSVLERRSAAASRLIVVYHSPALILKLVRPLLFAIGEPLRSAYTPPAFQALLAQYGFHVLWDEDVAALGAALSPALGRAIQNITHLRVATGDRL